MLDIVISNCELSSSTELDKCGIVQTKYGGGIDAFPFKKRDTFS
jgi:hypothetical protein